MKSTIKNTGLPGTVLALGLIALVLRLLLFRFCIDEKGLLAWNHPLEIALWILSAAVVVLVAAGIWKRGGSSRYPDNFRPSVPAMAGCLLLAAAMVVTVATRWNGVSSVGRVRNLLGIAAAAALVWVGLCRWRGKRPFFVCHLLLSVFYGCQAVLCYRPWSGDPLLQKFLFELLAEVLLMLFAYQQACFDVGLGKRRLQLFAGLLAAYACFATAGHTEHLLLYLASGLWAITNLCSLTPVRCRRTPGGEAPREQL